MKMLQKIENASKSVIAATTAVGAIMGILAGIYHGIYKLNQTANNIVRTIPIVENNSRFADINVDYDISLAEKQLAEQGNVDRILMRKLLLYKKDLKLTSGQITNINYLESKTRY